jgi:hypothetical protein
MSRENIEFFDVGKQAIYGANSMGTYVRMRKDGSYLSLSKELWNKMGRPEVVGIGIEKKANMKILCIDLKPESINKIKVSSTNGVHIGGRGICRWLEESGYKPGVKMKFMEYKDGLWCEEK